MDKTSVYLFPQNSCPCSEACIPPRNPLAPVYVNGMEDGKMITDKTNRECNVPDMFKHCQNRVVYNRVEYGQDQIPYSGAQSQNYTNYNPQVYSEKYDRGFGKVMNPPASGFPTITYKTRDPRAFDEVRAQSLNFNAPPINGSVKLKDIYDEKYRNYGNIGRNALRGECGSGAGGRADINDGQVMYYVGKEREDAYFRPIFSSPASVTTMMYKTPMSGVVPEYSRGFPEWKNPTLDQRNDCGHFCASWVRDEDFHRQELFSSYEASQKNRIVRARGSTGGVS